MAKRIRERVQVGTDANNNPIYEWATGYNRQELLLNAAELLCKYRKTPITVTMEAPKSPYFETSLESWWKTYKVPKLRHTTLATYRNLIDKHILPYFKGKRLDEIKISTIQTFYNDHAAMAKSSVRQMSIIMGQVFDLAVEDGYIKKNPVASKRLFIQGTKKKRSALKDEQVRSIIKGLCVLEPLEKMTLAILLYTGVRRGEALALKWEKIDWKKKLILIDESVTYKNNQPVFGPPKSEAGNRYVPLDDDLAEILKPYRQLSGLVLSENQKALTERMFTRMWDRIKEKIDLFGSTPHVLRHTYITLAASSGIDVKTLQSIAGHSNIKMTMDIYADARKEKVVEAAAAIRSVFAAL